MNNIINMKDKYISVKEKNKNYKDKTNEEIKQLNKEFIERKRKEYKNYFNNMFKNIDNNIKLDNEQIEAILNDEDYEIIIAGAGSGKTTTMAAKVKYLKEKLNVKPEEIIIVSYTNEAVNELKNRINKDFNIQTNIYTFHKFCLGILKKEQELKVLVDNLEVFENYFKLQRKYFVKFLKKDNKRKYLKFLINRKIDIYYIELCFKFFNLFKTNGYENFNNFKIKYQNNKKIYSFILLIEDISKYYYNFLKENKVIDFDGMIIECYKKLNKINLKYKYLIIDEYQDISYIRFKLIEKIAKLNNIKIIVVGDDFQSIYSFSGSDISLFVNFEKLMGYASILKITNTYRNSQELIDIVGKFVMKNQKQIKKDLISNKHLKNPIVLVKYKNNKIQKLERILITILNEYGINKKILLLGRYTHDIDFIKKSSIFEVKDKNNIIYKYNIRLNITFLTIHSSKGLGFDNVIILNNENSKYGFPSKVKTNKYLKILDKKTDKFLYAEERRLFYVALTRTKNKVYLMYPRYNPSIFIKELKKNF